MDPEVGMALLIPIIGVLIPVVALVLGLILALSAIKHAEKKRQLEHEERMLALEKGVSLPEAVLPPPRQRNPYLWGFILTALGLALCIGFIVEGDNLYIIWGGIFFLVGCAVLLANLLYKKDKKSNGGKSGKLEDVQPQTGSL